MKRRNLLKNLAIVAGLGLASHPTSVAIVGAFTIPEKETLRAALCDSRSRCVELFDAVQRTGDTPDGLLVSVQELRCLLDHAILVDRTERHQSPAFLQAASDSIGRVMTKLRAAGNQLPIGNQAKAGLVSSLQNSSHLLVRV